MFDLIIKNGLIVDGTGNPGYYGSVLVLGDEIHVRRGDISSVDASETIDATNHVVCPGFIDVHAHSGLHILSSPRHEPKVHQGVTTELVGVDGNSYAPFRSQVDLLRFMQLNAGLDGNPTLPGRWSTVEQYLRMFDHKVSVNIAYILGNSPVRIDAIGWEDKKATSDDLDNMAALVREAMEEGAFGISTGLEYPPGNYADTEELIRLSDTVNKLGGIYHTHVRYGLGDTHLDPFREAIEIGSRSGVPIHLTHMYQSATRLGGARELLELVESAQEDGMDVTFDSYPYIYGSTRLLIMFPDWAHEGGPHRLKQILNSSEGRRRLRKEVRPRAPSWDVIWVTNLRRPENHVYEGLSVSEISRIRGQDPVDTLCDILIQDSLQTTYVAAGVNGETLPDFVSHPLSMVGSDAVLLGDFPSPRTYGCFPVILSEYVREEKRLSLPEAVRKMTSFPAQRLGISNRGIIRDGMKADITVFDPAVVKAPATRRDPKQFPVGIEYVIVNGTKVIDKGRHTGALPGKSLKHKSR